MRSINADTVIAIALLALCGALFAETFTFEIPRLSSFGIRLWPRFIIGTLAVLSFIYLIRSLKQGPTEGRAPFVWRAWLAANRNVLACFGLFALFIATLPVFGMLIGGILFVHILLTVMGGQNNVRHHAINAAIAVVSVGGMWAIFTFALRVIMPGGIFNL
mgnify:CR=1 FL=1